MAGGAEGRCFGLIGGLGVGAAVHYYRELAKAHEARGVAMRLVMVHADMGRVFRHVQAGEVNQLARYLADLMAQLQAASAEFAAVPAVMPHICIGELAGISPLPLVNLLEVVNTEVQRRQLRRVALFGTRFTIETAMFGRLKGVEVVQPEPEEITYIHETYFQVASLGRGIEVQRNGLTNLAHALRGRAGVEAIVLAGTDLSLLFDESNTDFPHVDCARLHIDSIANSMLL